MIALMLEFPIDAMALASVPVETLANEAKVTLAAGRGETLVVSLAGDELGAEIASINAARAAHLPLDDLGIIGTSAQSMRAAAWKRPNSFADAD